MKKKIFIAVGVILALAIVAFFAYPFIRGMMNPGEKQSMYQTEQARMGSLTAYVGAAGAVRANQVASIAWETSGRVADVRVEKGQWVEAETVLAELSQSSLSQSMIMAQVDLINAKKELDKFLNNSEARTNAQLALVQAQKALDDAEKKSQSKLFQRASKETIDIARANLINANEALDSAEETFNQVKGLGEDSPVYAAGLSQYARARQEQQQAEYNLRYVQELPDPLDVEETYTLLDQAQSKLLSAKEEWERIKDGPDPDDIATAQARVAAAQATLDMTRLSAPFAGTIMIVDIQSGDLVSPGKVSFQIADLTRLLVDVQVSEVDINRVQLDQPVSLTFDGIPDREYSGFVSDIASTGSNESGAVNFKVTVEISDPDENIRPGMTAAVNIAVNQLDNILLVSSRAVRMLNNKRVVYVLQNNIPVPVEITLGFSSNNNSQITKGNLKAGDLIILNPPTIPSSGVMMGVD